MKETATADSRRQSTGGMRASTGVFRAPVDSDGGENGWLNNASMLQRTFGNAALGKMTGAKTPSSILSAKVFSQIVERGIRGDWGDASETHSAQNGGTAAQRAAAKSRGNAGGNTQRIQRLMHSSYFQFYTMRDFGTDKPEAIFTTVANGLQNYEAMPFNWVPQTAPVDQVNLMMTQWRARIAALRAIYKQCDEWMLTPEGENSKGSGLIKLLMGEMRDAISPQAPPTHNPAGTALGKTSNVTVDRTAKLTPQQQKAIEVIDNTTLHKQRKEHCHDMIRNPEMIQQGAFGVCGLTSILYTIASASPVRFAEIIRDAWADTALVTKWLEVFYNNADPRHIEIRSEVEYIAAQWVVRKSQEGKGKGESVSLDQEDLDYWTRRESQKSKTQLYKDVFDRQKDFSDSFEINGWENTLGHFALTAGALSHLLNGLGTGKPSFKIKRKSFAENYSMALRRQGSTGSILASVTNTAFYQSDKDVTTDYLRKDGTKGGTKPPKRTTTGGTTTGGTTTSGTTTSGTTTPSLAPKYVHWVVLKDAKLGTDGFYTLDIWTWQSNYKARVHKDVIGSHIYSLVVANGKLW